MAYEKINGALALATNSPGLPTGYGVQAEYLVERLLRHGIDTAVFSNYGLEGTRSKISTQYGKAEHFPKGLKPYSDDVIPVWYEQFMRERPGKPGAVMTLFDVWVFNQLKFDGDILSWVPIDHVTLPPGVTHFLSREQVTPIAMSPHGKRLLDAEFDIDSTYIPHAVDTSIFKPTKNMRGQATRKFMGVPDDAFLVTMVAANKANGIVHRKAFAEQLIAFSHLRKKHPDAMLYLHTTPERTYNGFNLKALLPSVGLDAESVIIADENQLRVGYPQKELAAIYTASDVLLAASYGEGFGVPLIEAQACGTRVITGNWTAMPDLVADTSYLVQGQPFWDEPQLSFFQVPLIQSVYNALEEAYAAERGLDQASLDWAQQFGLEKVWADYWLPFLRDFFERRN